MQLTRWDPFQDLMRLQGDAYGSWAPAVDIFEKGNDLMLRAEVPGVERDAIDVRVENNTLTLRGERRKDTEIEDEKAYRRERSYGVFSRSFRLPTTVDSTKIAATYKDGILEIVLPKSDTAKPRKVEIHAR